MLQKELAKRLKARYDTKMDGSGWMEVSSDGIPLRRIKYNGQFLSNADQNLSDEYRSKIADIQDEISAVREYVGLYEHAPQMKAADVSDYRQLAAFGDTVLAATYSEKNGFMFCTWKQNADGNSVFWGDYSPNYEYVRLCMSEKMVVRIFIWTEYITRFIRCHLCVFQGGLLLRMLYGTEILKRMIKSLRRMQNFIVIFLKTKVIIQHRDVIGIRICLNVFCQH